MHLADMFHLAKLWPCLNQRLWSAWCFVERPPFQRSFLCWRVAQPWDEDWCRGFRSCHSARCHRPEPPASARVHRDHQSHPSRSGSPRTEDLAAFLSVRRSQPAAPNATSHLQRHGTKLQLSLPSEPSPEPSQHPSLLWGLMVRCVSAQHPTMLAAQDGAAPTHRFCCSCSPSPKWSSALMAVTQNCLAQNNISTSFTHGRLFSHVANGQVKLQGLNGQTDETNAHQAHFKEAVQ